MSALHLALLVAGFTAFLTLIGWMIKSQVNINTKLADNITKSRIDQTQQTEILSKALQEAIFEFKIAVKEITTRSESQKELCHLHKSDIAEKHKELKDEIVRVDERLTDHIEGTTKPRIKRRA